MSLNRSVLSVGVTLFLSATLLLPVVCRASIPVVDFGAIANLIKNYNQLKTQYSVLKNTYQTAQQQLSQAKQLRQDSEGHYGFGGLMNSQHDLQNREWSPDNWKGTLQGVSGGNPARYQELIKTYQHDHPHLSQSAYQKGTSAKQATVYSRDVQVNRAAMVNATYSFNDIKTHLTTIHALSKKIDQAQNTKAATDLNSRLLVEVAYIQTQALKMQILMNQQMAQANADGLSSKSASATFNTLPQQ